MKNPLALIGFVMSFALADQALCQAEHVEPDAYETLSDSNRRIVSAIYEAQLGSRRDLAGHPLMGKDEITAMRRKASWKDIHGWLVKRGYVVTQTLAQAVGEYNRDTLRTTNLLIISTAAGEQRVVTGYQAERVRAAPPDPALANIIPVPITKRAAITVFELPMVTTAAPDENAPVPETMVGGVITSSVAANTMSQSAPR